VGIQNPANFPGNSSSSSGSSDTSDPLHPYAADPSIPDANLGLLLAYINSGKADQPEAMAKVWNQISSYSSSSATTLSDALTTLAQSWSGPAATEFTTQVQRIVDYANHVSQVTGSNGMAGASDSLASVLRSKQQAVAAIHIPTVAEADEWGWKYDNTNYIVAYYDANAVTTFPQYIVKVQHAMCIELANKTGDQLSDLAATYNGAQLPVHPDPSQLPQPANSPPANTPPATSGYPPPNYSNPYAGGGAAHVAGLSSSSPPGINPATGSVQPGQINGTPLTSPTGTGINGSGLPPGVSPGNPSTQLASLNPAQPGIGPGLSTPGALSGLTTPTGFGGGLGGTGGGLGGTGGGLGGVGGGLASTLGGTAGVSPGAAGAGGLNSAGAPGSAGTAADSALGASAATAGRGMPMMPPMMPPMGMGNSDKDRQRKSWLPEDEDIWGGDGTAVPPVISGDA
jgi:hypothetical protein